MELKELKGTDLKVSRLCFGTMTFGKPVDQTTATSMVSRCMDEGINFFDTANMYQTGVSESYLGNALQGRRDKVVLASKVAARMGDGPDQSGLSPAAIRREVDESLRRLKTDYLDLYYLHFPDYKVPVEDTLRTLDGLVRTGKVRWIGTSNYASWQVCEMLNLSSLHHYRPPMIAQQMYNLIARGLEQEFIPFSRHHHISIIAYNPLAGGLLTGKHSQSQIMQGSRFDDNRMYQDRYWHPQNFKAVEELAQIAKRAGRSLVSLSFAWLLHHQDVQCMILGASRPEQLEQNLAACKEGPLSPEILRECDEVWSRLRGPIPIYNR